MLSSRFIERPCLKIWWRTLEEDTTVDLWYTHTKRWGKVGRDRQHTETDRETGRHSQRDTERKGGITGRKALKSIITGASSFTVTSACQSEDAFHF